MTSFSAIVSLVTIVITFSFGEEIDPLMCRNLENGSKVASPVICNQFFVCNDGEMVGEGSCPPNMLFDPESQECDFPENVDCRNVPLPPGFENEVSTEATAKCPDEDPEDPVFLPVDGDCGAYILCFHGREILRRCPENHYWDSEANDCGRSENVKCQIKDKFGCPDEGIEYLPHPDDCRMFIYCRNGFSRLQHCAFFNVFDADLKKCVLGDSCV